MAKAKKTKRPMSDSVYAKKSKTATNSNPFATARPSTSKKLSHNPFEVHVNKEKFQILGRTCKHDKGLPGVSRAKAEKRRQQTLGREYVQKNKSNQFHDRRIGKHLSGEDLSEEVINARFLADKLSQFKGNKTSKFDLNDDEILTHRGTTLEEIEQFRDIRSDDEDSNDERLDADFTESAHFGGGENGVKDRKTAIEEMIVEQKKRKMELAKEKDELHDLTHKLDSNYKDLVTLMGKMSKKGDKEKPAPDDFDKIMREMVFEPRGAVTDKLESVEEVAKKEKERLEKLEQERLKRMRGDCEETNENAQPKHRSADELDDGYFAYGEQVEEDGILAYNMDGELGTKNRENGKSNGVAENGEEDEDEDEEDDEDEDEDDDSDEESEDDLSDLKADDSDDETNEKTQKVSLKKNQLKNITNGLSVAENSEIPFTIEMPTKYNEFLTLMTKHTTNDQAIIVERLIKCNHPKLDGVNREKVVKLFAYLLQYMNELFGEATPQNVTQHFQLLDKINPHLFDLMHLNPEKMPTTLLDVIKEKYKDYFKHPKAFPTLDTLVFLKLVSNFFTTSDFRHPVVTPCYIFIEHVLQRARVRTRRDIAAGLFLVTIALEYAQQSKRFLPAAFNFLLGTVFLCVPKRAVELIKVIPPFKSKGPLSSLLVLTAEEVKNVKAIEVELLKSDDLILEDISVEFKTSTLNTCLGLMKEMIEVVGENIGANYLAEPLLGMLERLPVEIYPEFVQQSFDAAKAALSTVAKKPLTKLVPPEKKPKALRLLEPRFETVYDDKRRPKMSKEKEEKVKLLHKIKRETKGAVREIRRDTEFLQKMRIQQQIRSDHERKEKVRKILHEASVQQGELNEFDRAKKRKKF